MKALPFSILIFLLLTASAATADVILLEGTQKWREISEETEGVVVSKNGVVELVEREGLFVSRPMTFDEARQPVSLIIQQPPVWENWDRIPNVGPKEASDAPILLPIAEGNYWFFGLHAGGYRAWKSTDMETWEPKGLVNPKNWGTTAEYADGKIYFYYDHPNDQDPHLVIGENLDGEPTWTQMGMVFDDPSDGSDTGVIRTQDGVFHLVYEDWTPINARQHSWDSPLAGHADSPDGIHGYEYGDNPPAIDHRTTPTGEKGSYNHPFTEGPLTYDIHEPEQDAYGDYTLIGVGNRFYLFCDYHPAGDHLRIGIFSSESMYKPFEMVGELGRGHPDPTVGFAEGRFYLIIQRGEEDYVSRGPWVDSVEVRVGVDVENDGKTDHWTDWQQVREVYQRKPGFARLVDSEPAALDLTSLPAGRAFRFELRLKDVTENASKPAVSQVRLRFE